MSQKICILNEKSWNDEEGQHRNRTKKKKKKGVKELENSPYPAYCAFIALISVSFSQLSD